MAMFSNVAGIAGSRGLGPKQRTSRGSLNYSIEPTLSPVLGGELVEETLLASFILCLSLFLFALRDIANDFRSPDDVACVILHG